ncbi:FAD-dependent monooxygenase [Catellatospora citrea]|uniref:FAD-binding monooxygenase n=1 Tax=Catellatospora citrea TaxID=53366 RepID=A0A8J3KAJ4_9ACTN|nr:FAD-dependent monooxygenase [Catellatospora citrea]RKE12437.1 2-polyprenyl-6-methoxyphenol hydroxylase-like FAD-dependent oxidoreductase [Catellatospora citrea]GIF96331.1 FAD-binding monooxygenase [Catellatospora citrea]
MTGRRVLVSGASIAGPALAHWLHEYGMTAVVVERHDGIRPGGQTVDLRGAGRTVARRMGIEDAVRARSTSEDGVAFVDARNRVKAAFPAQAFGGEGFVAELEILRGELAGLLHERTRGHTEYVFGDRITAVDDRDDGVRVSFAHGADRSFDLVVAADGIGSTTRGLVFGGEARVVPLGLYTSYLTVPRAASDGSWARWHNAPGGRVVALRPDNLGTTRALMSFLCPPRGYERLPVGEQKELLRRVFAGVGWEAPRVLRALGDADEFYCELVGQVRAPRWSRGRVALVGDAGYCASPISGMGTSLALVGAYVLAGELASHSSHRDAFAAYERIMRPYVAQAQHLPPFTPRIAHPRSRVGIGVLNTLLATAANPVVQRVAARFLSPPADRIDLPDYTGLRRR